jgi:hypothetical protein
MIEEQNNDISSSRDSLNELTAEQKKEIMKIRQNGAERQKYIIEQINHVKSKASDIINESNIQNSARSNSLAAFQELANKNQQVIDYINNSKIVEKVEKCEEKMQSFESVIESLLFQKSQFAPTMQNIDSFLSPKDECRQKFNTEVENN